MEHSSPVRSHAPEQAGIAPDIALSIALAARTLPEVEIRDLLSGIISLVGEPLTKAKLTKLKVSKLKQLGCLEEVDVSYLKEALAILKGRGIEQSSEPLPQIEKWQGDLEQGSIFVACASNTSDQIDGHFGSCTRFLIYRLSSAEKRLVDIRVPGPVDEGEDKNALRAALLKDCQVLYTVSIGGPAAAKVVRAGLHPVKLPAGGSAPEILLRLQSTIANSPPPWLAKAMGFAPEDRVRFREGATA